jgi:cytochrome P450
MRTPLMTEQLLNPFPWYQTMRQERPVFYDEQSRVWHVFRYDEVLRVLTDHTAFSKGLLASNETLKAAPVISSVLRADPLSHRQLHNIVMQAFAPHVIERLEPRVSNIITTYLDRVITTGEMDVIKDLAFPLPILVIGHLLGIEQDEHFKRWLDALISEGFQDHTSEQRASSFQAMMPQILAMCQSFTRVLEERRRHPQNDLVSALTEAHIQGQYLSDSELVGFFVVLLGSGTQSTTTLIGNAILCFDEHPEIMDCLRTRPALLPTAIEEVLRYRSPVQALNRVTTREVILGDQRINAGQTIIAWLGSANHDEAQFPEPERFDIQRQPNRHLAFAHGIHFCVGAPLARLEVRILLNAMLERLTELHRRRDIPLDPIRSPGLFALKSLPITFRMAH